MKKSKGELLIEFAQIFFNYLDRHPMQGRIAVIMTLFFLGIKTCASEIASIIIALHICK